MNCRLCGYDTNDLCSCGACPDCSASEAPCCGIEEAFRMEMEAEQQAGEPIQAQPVTKSAVKAA